MPLHSFTLIAIVEHLVEETQNFAGDMLSPGFFMIHDSSTGCEDNVSKLTGWKKLDNPLLEISELDIVSWADTTGLVQSTTIST
jgi:hypothetical protein